MELPSPVWTISLLLGGRGDHNPAPFMAVELLRLIVTPVTTILKGDVAIAGWVLVAVFLMVEAAPLLIRESMRLLGSHTQRLWDGP